MEQECKLVYGLEGAMLNARTGSFSELDVLADTLMMDAGHELVPGGEYAGRTFVIVLINSNGSTCYARHYTVSN